VFRTLRNLVGLIGAVFFITSVVTFVFLSLLELFGGEVSPYVGLFHLLILPMLGTLGLGLMVIGYLMERRKKRHALESGEMWAPADLGSVRVRQRLLLTAGGISGLLVFVMAAGGVRAIEYTESNEFCGNVCHTVMRPEYTAWQNSAHARVACVDCHVGEGASHYLQAKVNGLHQVYAVIVNDYPKPIPTPVHNMRDARDTCETCHWSQKRHGDRRKTFTHYLTDGTEEPWLINLILRVGGGDPERGYAGGIHWHMNLANTVEFVARDERREDIAWVRFVDGEGNETVYEDVDEPLTADQRAGRETRRMDCLDCHNRPAHQYHSPIELLNDELLIGNLDPEMPDIKFLGLEVLAASRGDDEDAAADIAGEFTELYAADFPDYYDSNRAGVERAAAVLQRIYDENTFPAMNVRWDSYPDFSGHWGTAGCFRCHAGNLASSDGRVISSDCNTCHTIASQGFASDPIPHDGDRNPFVHPGDFNVIDEPILCHECHDGVLGLGGSN
jgi:nitrate/TMAO reductase-like tetraheme cytochrome c subunit